MSEMPDGLSRETCPRCRKLERLCSAHRAYGIPSCRCQIVNETNPAQFESEVVMAPRIGDKTRWCANVRIRCVDCKTEFRFEGLPGGILHGMKPATPGHMGYGACLPITPLLAEQNAVVQQADPWVEGAINDFSADARTSSSDATARTEEAEER